MSRMNSVGVSNSSVSSVNNNFSAPAIMSVLSGDLFSASLCWRGGASCAAFFFYHPASLRVLGDVIIGHKYIISSVPYMRTSQLG
jgi:hypothetical protein